MSKKVNKSNHTYIIYADRNTSQFDQKRQIMRCKVLEIHSDYMLVESLKRYNKKYAGANTCESGKFQNMPVRRINKEQARIIIDESTGRWITWETVQRREGTLKFPGRSRGGK
jgi:hypothetical protein